MKPGFSTRAFASATLTYAVLTLLIGGFEYQAALDADHAGHLRQTMFWIEISNWIWTPVPRLITYVFPFLKMYYMVFILMWSLCIGILFGFLVPHFQSLRRHFI